MSLIDPTPTKCLNCNEGTVYEKVIWIITIPCYNCVQDMNIAVGVLGFTIYGPPYFEAKEIEVAVMEGVILKDSYSNQTEDSYLANICPHCNSFCGDFYLAEYRRDADSGNYAFKKIDTGIPACDNCSNNSSTAEEDLFD